MDLSRYLGIPFVRSGRDLSGLDCYGFIWLVYREILGVELPRYEGACTLGKEHAEVQALIDAHLGTNQWIPVPLEEIEELDVLFLERFGRMHCGVSLGRHKIMHMDKERGICVDDYRRRGSITGRIVQCFRHSSRAA